MERATLNKSSQEVLENTIGRCREKNIIIPTYEQMRNPETVPQGIKEELKNIGLWDLHPLNLFRITWKNEPVKKGGGFGGVNFLEYPRELTGVKPRIFTLLGKFFPHRGSQSRGHLRTPGGKADPGNL